MISIDSAIDLVSQYCQLLGNELVALNDARGRIVADGIIAGEASPPFTKSLVDGFAVNSTEFALESVQLPVSEILVAGDSQMPHLQKGTAIKIMTGAPIPEGADCVVMVEQTETQKIDGAEFVVIHARDVKTGGNVLPRASVVSANDVILDTGEPVTESAIGALAEFGKQNVNVVCKPHVSVLTTGNEVVDCSQPINHAQIRNSNGPMLCSHLRSRGCEVFDLGIAGDNRQNLTERIARGLSSNILLLSGGVSAGVLDLVPGVLKDSGVKQVFHKVALKPGKPIWFGVYENADHRCLVFGLPGNPVSSLVCFLLFVAQAIKKLTRSNESMFSNAVLDSDFVVSGDRPACWPSLVAINENAKATVTPLVWKGSSDLLTASKANTFVFFPEPGITVKKGTVVKTINVRYPAR